VLSCSKHVKHAFQPDASVVAPGRHLKAPSGEIEGGGSPLPTLVPRHSQSLKRQLLYTQVQYSVRDYFQSPINAPRQEVYIHVDT
jgi:hypothetical protein